MPRTIKHNKFHAEPWDVKGRYVHREGPSLFCAYYNGYSRGRKERTYAKAAENLFDGIGAGCYQLLYYWPEDNQMVLFCSECALDMWLEDPRTKFRVENSDTDAKYEGSMDCENCNKVIVKHLCPECGDPIDGPPGYLFIHRRDENNRLTSDGRNRADDPSVAPEHFVSGWGLTVHGQCLAHMVVEGGAKKIGKQTYEIEWAGKQVVKGPRAVVDETTENLARWAENAELDREARLL